MKSISFSRPFSRFAPLCAALIAALACAFLFREAFAPGFSLLSPDSQLWRYDGWRDLALTNFFGGRYEIPTFDSLLYWLFPLPLGSTLGYLFATALLALGGTLYLRHWKCPAPAAILGGLSLAFAGYHFTLFSAGHRGYFIMTVYAIFLLSAIDRLVETGRWPYAVFAAVCAVSALRPQPDVFALWAAVLAAYALMRVILLARAAASPKRYLLRLGGAVAVFLVIAALFGGPSIRYTLTSLVAGRESQLADAEQSTATSPEDAATARWDFATSWSFPPAELPELLCPNLRGYDSGNAKGPYWGSVGRDVHYAETRQGFYNFRQHTLYLGVIPVLFAVVALCHGLRKKDPEEEACEADARPILLFWGVVAVGALLLALGRYTPLYRLFFSLPMMSSIRGPLKFLHFTEAAVAILAGFGCARLSRERFSSRAAVALGLTGYVLASILLIFSFVAPTEALNSGLAALGIPAQSMEPYRTMLLSIRGVSMRITAVFAGLTGGVLLWSGFAKRPLPRWAAPALVALTLFDMMRAATPYVNPVDTRTYAMPNALVESLRKSGQLEASMWGGSANGLEAYFPFIQSFEHHYLLQADPQRGQDPTRPSMQAAMHMPASSSMRRWELLGTRIVLFPVDVYQRIPADAHEFVRLGTYAYTQSGVVAVKDPAQAQFGAVALRDWVPNGSVYTHWQTAASAEEAWRLVSDPKVRLANTLVVTGEVPASPAGVPTRAVPSTCLIGEKAGHYRRLVFETREDSPAGLFFIRNQFNGFPEVVATVDGEPTDILTANALFRAVPVSAGKHTIEFRVPLHTGVVAVYAATCLLLVAAVVVVMTARARA